MAAASACATKPCWTPPSAARSSCMPYGDPPPDLADLAASLAFGLARNHPFIDGNKRTAAVACETFLVLNGASLQADDLELYPVYIALAEGSCPKPTSPLGCAGTSGCNLQARCMSRAQVTDADDSPNSRRTGWLRASTDGCHEQHATSRTSPGWPRGFLGYCAVAACPASDGQAGVEPSLRFQDACVAHAAGSPRPYQGLALAITLDEVTPQSFGQLLAVSPHCGVQRPSPHLPQASWIDVPPPQSFGQVCAVSPLDGE